MPAEPCSFFVVAAQVWMYRICPQRPSNLFWILDRSAIQRSTLPKRPAAQSGAGQLPTDCVYHGQQLLYCRHKNRSNSHGWGDLGSCRDSSTCSSVARGRGRAGSTAGAVKHASGSSTHWQRHSGQREQCAGARECAPLCIAVVTQNGSDGIMAPAVFTLLSLLWLHY